MQYFVRTMEKHKESSGAFSTELPCYGLAAAKAEAKRLVLSANPALQLHADAMTRRLQGRELHPKLANLHLPPSAATKPKTGNKG